MSQKKEIASSESQEGIHTIRTKEIIFAIRRLMQAGEHYTKELNKIYNVSAAQINCLIALQEHGPLSPSQIAKHVMVNSSTITGIIDRLEKKDLVRRLRISPDRRVVTVELTKAGQILAQNAPPPIQQKLIDGLQRLSPKEIDEIASTLKRLIDMLDVRDLKVTNDEIGLVGKEPIMTMLWIRYRIHMNKHKRVMLIHALTESMEPIHKAFGTHWPEAEIYDLLDSSLSADHAANQGVLDEKMMERFQTLGRYAAVAGPGGRATDGILFTCSAFGPAIDAVKQELRIPVLKPNEAAFARALKTGRRIGLLVTFQPSLPSLSAELRAMAAEKNIPLELEARVIPEALAALHQGKPEEHDNLIAQAAAELGPVDALVIGQFSMARSAKAVGLRVNVPVITTPDSAVLELRRLLEAPEGGPMGV